MDEEEEKDEGDELEVKSGPTSNSINSASNLPPSDSPRRDQGIVSDSESSPHYRNGDEPEPIDLTHLNVEASMMCLASKVRSICGKANSPTLSARTFRFKELDSMKRTVKGWQGCQASNQG